MNLPYGKRAAALALCGAVLTAPAFAAEEERFLIDTTEDLATLCAAAPVAPTYAAAIHMCQGYIIGVAHFHQALTAELDEGVYCAPTGDDRPSRNEAVAMFVDWVGKNPSVGETEALDGLLQWAASAFPCN
ncbi:MAG: Rap1a/Tai family immunity protein [Pseudomonadota bacterium]